MGYLKLALTLGLLYFSIQSAVAAEFNYSDLESLIRSQNIVTVEDLLARLPETYKRNYLLVYESRSLQARNVSPEFPRIILFGNDASFIVALTKNPATPPVVAMEDAIETMQFDSETRQFVLRKLIFDGHTSPFRSPVEANPSECASCHRRDPRPNWDPYNIWPGVYGSISRGTCSTMQRGTKELQNYLSFLQKNRNEGRYRFLPTAINPGEYCPNDPANELTFTNGNSTDPAEIFGELVYRKNAVRIQRKLESQPSFSKFRYLWAALSNGCLDASNTATKLETYFPDGYAAAQRWESFSQILAKNLAETRQEYAQRLANFYRNNKGGQNAKDERFPTNFLDPNETYNLGNYRYVWQEAATMRIIAERMGMDVSDWQPMLADGSFGAPSGGDPLRKTWEKWPYIEQSGLKQLSCDELTAKSRASF